MEPHAEGVLLSTGVPLAPILASPPNFEVKSFGFGDWGAGNALLRGLDSFARWPLLAWAGEEREQIRFLLGQACKKGLQVELSFSG